MKKKVIFGSIFVILAFGVMFADSLWHLRLVEMPSMALTHGAHGTSIEHDPLYVLEQGEMFALPFRTPDDAIERLPYREVDGVKEFTLTVDEIMWEYSEGKYVHAWGYNQQIPGPEIRVNDGDRVRVIVENNLPVPTTVHWHGVHVENEDDGVPGFTQYPIEPGETYVYEFTAIPAGTRFYHSHGNNDMGSVTQMDMGLSGAFIIEPNDDSLDKYDREFVFLLDEWQINPDGSNGALVGLSAAGGHAHGNHGGGYNVFTMNGRIEPFIPPMEIKEGELILMRLINVGTQEIHPMHLHGHEMDVVAIDGYALAEPQQYTRDVVTLTPAERFDVAFIANNPGAWMFHCHHLHHAAGGMSMPVLYEGWEPCCEDI